MRVLITGAAGFLGQHVTKAMMEAGHDVTAFDQNVTDALDVRWIQGDLVDQGSVMDAVKGNEAVVHIGAIGDVYLAGDQPPLAAAVNVTGSANIAMAAKEAGARIVYASTWEVYGEPVYQPLDESHPTNPDHPYNITKLGGEQMLLAADHLHDVPVVALRLGTAYGTGLRPNSVFRIFIDRARRGDPITIQGDGLQGRQFTHASDLSRAFLVALDSDVRGMAFNTVAPEMTSIRTLAELVTARYPTELTFGEPRPGDVPAASVSPDRIAEVLGWRAEKPFGEGLDELMDSVEAEG